MSYLKLGIGGVTMEVGSSEFDWGFDAQEYPQCFVVDSDVKADARIDFFFDPVCHLRDAEHVFSAGRRWAQRPGWRLLKDGNLWLLQLNISQSSTISNRVVAFEPDFSVGQGCVAYSEGSEAPFANPLEHPLDRLWLTNLLSVQGFGMLHGCAINDNGRGFLFVGAATSGKSTLAKLWMTHSEAVVLSDECVVLRKSNGRFWIYGTPWTSSAGACSSEGVPLDRVFLISHGKANEIVSMKRLDIVSSLLAESFPTFWNRAGMASIMDLCLELSLDIPCDALHFLPSPHIVDFVRQAE